MNNEVYNRSLLQKKKKRRIKKKAVMWALIFLTFFVILLISLIKIIVWFKDNNNTNKIIEEITDNVEIIEVKNNEETEFINEVEKESDYWYYVKQPLISVDVDTLKEKNKDTIGWIQVNNTNVNYPFVQTSNNEYYLNHAFDKSYNSAGWVFLDYRNNTDFSDRNNIIYAHARRDNTMFGSLRNVIKESWYSNKDNRIIKLSTETENSMWQVFSVYRIETESYYITTAFSSDEVYENFLKTLQERSMYNFDVKLSKDDKILTLSTCNGENHRIVIHAKLIKKSVR